MAHNQPATVTHTQEHPRVFRGIEELREEGAHLEQEALSLSSPRVTAQRLADLNRRAEEALR